MKKIITICLMVFAFVSTTFADETKAALYQTIRLGASVDYTILSMEQVNNDLGKGTSVTKLNSGIAGMLDLDVILAPFFMVGARTGYIYCPPASVTHNFVFSQTTTINAALIPLEAGVIVNFGVPATAITLMAGAFGGYGFAAASYKDDFNLLGLTGSVTRPYRGQSYIGELIGAVNLKVSDGLSVNVNGGYRMAKITQMKLTTDVNYTGIPFVTYPVGKKGDVLKDADNNDLAFDFSGFNIGVGLSLGF